VIKAAAGGLAALVVGVVLVAAATGGVAAQFLGDPGGSGGGGQSAPSATALGDIPPGYLLLYMSAARSCPGLDWTVLAGIGSVESDHGQSTLPGVHSGLNSASLAEGPMQFEPATFAEYATPVPSGGADPPSPYDPVDAIYAAARDLCANGARDGADITAAIYSYNHADWYVAEVLDRAATYAAHVIDTGPAAPSRAAQEAINYAEGQLGLPYEWDGSGPEAGDAGFDCSGLTRAAYQAAGISLPHNAAQQYAVTPHVPAGDPLEPGDLVFFGTSPATIHHVGLYVGGGQMIDAPDYGIPVRIEPYKESDYYGASRPVAPATGTASS
jgi:cell wall-associated NlpC family hydrolase